MTKGLNNIELGFAYGENQIALNVMVLLMVSKTSSLQ